MAEGTSDIDDEAPLQPSLGKIQRSINSLAAEQHEMHELIKELWTMVFKTHGIQTQLETNKLFDKRQTQLETDGLSGKRNSLDFRPETSETPLRWTNRKVADLKTMEADAIRASKEDESGLDPAWPATLQLRIGSVISSSISEQTNHISSSNALSSASRGAIFQGQKDSRCDSLDGRRRMNATIILPTSRLRVALDMFGACLLAWDLFFTPAQLAWNLNVEEGWLFIAAVAVSSFWTLDMVAFFRTAFQTKMGEFETRPWKIALHYMRHQFLIDFMIVLCDWVNIFAIGIFPSGLSLLRALKFTRLLRLFRLINVSRFERIEDFVNTFGISNTVFDSIKILAFTTWLAHAISCVWFAIGQVDASDTGLHWLYHTQGAENAPSYADSSVGYQYTSSLQWTLTTMLSGTSPILPLNSAEFSFSCSCVLLGLMMQAFVVSVLSSTAVEQKARHRYQTVTMSSLTRLCSKHKVRMQLAMLACSQVKKSLAQSKKAALRIDQVDGLQKISRKLRMQILNEVFEPQLSRNALFVLWSQADPRTFSKLTSDLMNLIYPQREHDIFTAGDTAAGMYILSHGKASYSQSPESSKSKRKCMEELELDTWICEPVLWMEWLHVGTAEANSDDCEIHILYVEGFLALVQSVKISFKHILSSYAILYHERVVQSVPPAIPWPSDLRTHGTSFVQMLTSMHESVRNIATSLALDYATVAGLVDETQSNILTREVEEGKSNLVIAKAGAYPSVQRVVSVARVFASRSDGHLFVEIGSWSSNRLVPKVQLPGAKQLGSEDIFTTVRRVVDNLTPTVGNLQMDCVETNDEIHFSSKVNLKTHYYFFDVFFTLAAHKRSYRRGSLDRALRSVSIRHSDSNFINRTLSVLGGFSNGFSVSSSVIHHLEERMLSGSELFLIGNESEDIDSKPVLCMWLSEQELSFLATPDGAKFVEGLVDKGQLTRTAAINIEPTTNRSGSAYLRDSAICVSPGGRQAYNI